MMVQLSYTIYLCPMYDDCLLCIFKYLTDTQLYPTLLVCKQFYNAANNNILWKHLFNTDFPKIIIPNDNNYKLKYQQFADLNYYLIDAQVGCADEMYHAKALDVWYDHCPLLPPEIGLLTNLENLRLVANNLKSIPREIGLLTNLRELDLSNNYLLSVPMEIELLTNLERLDLHNNLLQTFPINVKLLTNLHTLKLDDCLVSPC